MHGLARLCGRRSPRWQYQVSERSPLLAPLLSMNMVDGGKESGAWKLGTVFARGAGLWFLSIVTPVDGCTSVDAIKAGGRQRQRDEREMLTTTCFRGASKLSYGYKTRINKRACTQAKGQVRRDKLQWYRCSCSIRNRRCSVISVSSAQTEEGEERVDPLFEETACSAALRRSFIALNSSSNF